MATYTPRTIETPNGSFIEATTWTTTGYGPRGLVGVVTIHMRASKSSPRREYDYTDVPIQVYAAMHRCNSIGKGYNALIKRRFACTERRALRIVAGIHTTVERFDMVAKAAMPVRPNVVPFPTTRRNAARSIRTTRPAEVA